MCLEQHGTAPALLSCQKLTAHELFQQRGRLGLGSRAHRCCHHGLLQDPARPPAQSAVGEPQSAVRSAALACLARVLERVRALPPSDAKLISECARTPRARIDHLLCINASASITPL